MHHPGTGAVHLCGVLAEGDPQLLGPLDALQGASFASLGLDLDAVPAFGELVHLPVSEIPNPLREQVWSPARLVASVGITVLDGDHCAGRFSVVSRAPFDPEALRSARQLEGRIVAQGIEASRQEAVPNTRHVWILDAEGAVEIWSPGAPTFSGQHAVVPRIHALIERGGLRDAWFEGTWHLSLARMHTEADADLWVVTATPTRPFRVRPILGLTVAQRQVAKLLGRGATVAHAARRLGRSENTVRTHLKAVYATCGIGTRAQLARLVAEWDSPE